MEKRYSDDSGDAPYESERASQADQDGGGTTTGYVLTKNIYTLANFLKRDVDDITAMPYAAFLFWQNFAYQKYLEDKQALERQRQRGKTRF